MKEQKTRSRPAAKYMLARYYLQRVNNNAPSRSLSLSPRSATLVATPVTAPSPPSPPSPGWDSDKSSLPVPSPLSRWESVLLGRFSLVATTPPSSPPVTAPSPPSPVSYACPRASFQEPHLPSPPAGELTSEKEEAASPSCPLLYAFYRLLPPPTSSPPDSTERPTPLSGLGKRDEPPPSLSLSPSSSCQESSPPSPLSGMGRAG